MQYSQQYAERRPAIGDGRAWMIRRCQAGYVITSTSDDYKRTADTQGVVKTLDDAQDRVDDLVGHHLRWSHSTLSDEWVAVEARL
jgi:hypothetical protein